MRSFTVVMVGAFAMIGVATGAHAQSKCTGSELKAVGKKASCKLSLYAKAATKFLPVDTAKLASCTSKYTAAYNKAVSGGGCITSVDVDTIETKVDNFVNDVNTELATGQSAASKCTGSELKAAGKKASCKLGLYSKAAAKALPVDTAKLASCTSKYTAAYAKAVSKGDCVTTVDQGTIETKVDNFVSDVNTELATPGPTKLAFTVLPGTTSCGAAGLATPPVAPLAGDVDSDTGCTTSVSPLGLGCLYFGGGNGTVIPPGAIPDGSTAILGIIGGTLSGANTGNVNTCTVGDGPGKHCINNNSLPACATDGNCGGAAGACGPDANCFFGPPLPIFSPPPFGALTTCILNVVHTTASGTANTTTGASSISLPLASRVYISGNTASPCPKCLSGSCDPTWKTVTATTSPDTGNACTAVGTKMTSNDCRPALTGFQAPLAVNLTPLTTGTTSETDSGGSFCPGQLNAGAFGKGTARCIAEKGQLAGDLSDQMPHNAHLVSVFCLAATGNGTVDGVSDLPGPGAFSLDVNSQLLP
jgi:hypothetical protein